MFHSDMKATKHRATLRDTLWNLRVACMALTRAIERPIWEARCVRILTQSWGWSRWGAKSYASVLWEHEEQELYLNAPDMHWVQHVSPDTSIIDDMRNW